MIRLTPETCIKVHEIFIKEQGRANPHITDIMDVLSLFDTYNVNSPVLGKSFAYWEFMHACLENIATNSWCTLPRMWVEYCCHSREIELLPHQIQYEYKRYLARRETLLKELGLSALPHLDKEVILYWVRHKKTEQYMLGIAHALVRMYIYFTQDDVNGLVNNSSKEPRQNDPSFDAADQAVWPLDGDNKFEVLKNNFKNPYKEHEAMI